jgi:hypothetical protein
MNNYKNNWMDDIFNIQSINSSQTSLAKVLLIFYVLVASRSTDSLMAKQMRSYIQENRYVQHILGFLVMIILVTLVGGIVDTRSAIVYALVGYIWFIFSTKLDIHWNLVILILLFVGYMYENSMSVREAEIMSDNNLTEEQKNAIIANDNRYKTMIVGAVMIVTVIGTIFYSHKKIEQYGGSYDVLTYIFN